MIGLAAKSLHSKLAHYHVAEASCKQVLTCRSVSIIEVPSHGIVYGLTSQVAHTRKSGVQSTGGMAHYDSWHF